MFFSDIDRTGWAFFLAHMILVRFTSGSNRLALTFLRNEPQGRPRKSLNLPSLSEIVWARICAGPALCVFRQADPLTFQTGYILRTSL